MKKLPGFRSGSRRNMVIASVVYGIVALGLLGALVGGDADASDPTPTPAIAAAPTATPEPEPDTTPAIDAAAIDEAVRFMRDHDLVSDAAATIDGDTVSLSLVVNAAMNEATARTHLDNFARYLATQVAFGNDDLRSPSADDLGGLWDHYTLHVGAGPDANSLIARGAKVTSSPRITWQ